MVPYSCPGVKHFDWASAGAIDAFYCSWWGPDSSQTEAVLEAVGAVTRFNERHEDTRIEPAEGYGTAYLEALVAGLDPD